LGAEVKLNHKVIQPPEELLELGYDAVYIACGFQQDAVLGIEGIDGDGVHTALRFLEAVARGEQPALGGNVLVVGGGNTAMDAARTAQRLTGCPTTVVYRRTEAEMPAEEEELRDLFDEGNRLEELVSPSRVILENGRVVALECVRNKLGEPGADGRRRPVAIESSEFEIEASAVILAIGQKPDIAFLDGSSLALRRNGAVRTSGATRQTDLERVYAGGDVTRGPAIIIEACEDGRRAAMAICKELGLDFKQLPAELPYLGTDEIDEVKRARTGKVAKNEPALLDVDMRAGFDLVEQTLAEEQARSEAARCLQCSTLCDKCVEVCPNRANYTYLVSPTSLSVPLLACSDGALVQVGEEPFYVWQDRQIVHVDDFCNECGNCATFCVHMGKPYVDKPRLFLEEEDFAQEQDNAFFIERTAEGNLMRRREGGQESLLLSQNGSLVFSNQQVDIKLGTEMEVLEVALKEPFDGTLSLVGVAEMALLLDGVVTSLPFLV
jgi:putative selenate reductase